MPSGIVIVRLRLLSGRTSVYTTYVVAHKAGTRQTIALPARLGRRLRPGRYTLSVSAGSSTTDLGAATTQTVLITNPSGKRTAAAR